MRCLVVVPEGKIALGKLAACLAYGAEVISIDGMRIQVLRADSRRVHTLLVDPQKDLPLTAPRPAIE